MAEPSEQTPPVAAAEPAVEPPKPIDNKLLDLDDTDVDSRPSSGVATPAGFDYVKSKKVALADLSAKGKALYTRRQYEDAAEIFSKASILQAELNGETAPENAEILFHYGRSLFKVGQSKSDVLGGTAATAEKKKKPNGAAKAQKPAAPAEAAQTEEEKVTEEGIAIVAEQKESEKKAEEVKADGSNPLFQFTGDENFDDSEDEEVRLRWLGSGDVARGANDVSRPPRLRVKSQRRRTMIWPLLLRFWILRGCATSSDWRRWIRRSRKRLERARRSRRVILRR